MVIAQKRIIPITILIAVPLLIMTVFWYVTRRTSEETVGTETPLQEEGGDNILGRNANPRDLSPADLRKEVEMLGQNPDQRDLSNQEIQEVLDSLEETSQGQR